MTVDSRAETKTTQHILRGRHDRWLALFFGTFYPVPKIFDWYSFHN